MANWTTATLLDRLTEKLADHRNRHTTNGDIEPDELVEDPQILGEMLASEVIEVLRAEVVREAMGRKRKT